MRRHMMLLAAALTCPCHLPLLALLLAGTAAGAFIDDNLFPLFAAFGLLFVGSLWSWTRQSSAASAGVPAVPETPKPESTAGNAEPLRVQILKTPGCASCSGVERSWQLLQPEYEGRVHLEVIDLLDHPEVAERYRVLRTPAVILNDRLRTQGSLSKERLRVLLDEALHARSVAAIGEETIRA